MAQPQAHDALLLRDDYLDAVEKYADYYPSEVTEEATHRAVLANICNWYLYLPFAAERLHRVLPSVKLVVSLREPVERAYSHWWMWVCQGKESESFGTAIERNIRRLEEGLDFSGPAGIERWKERNRAYRRGRIDGFRTYVDMGYYAAQLERLFSHFDRSRVELVFVDDLRDSPERLVRKLWEFAGVRTDVEVPDARRRGRTLGRAGSRVSRSLRALGLENLVPDPLAESFRRLMAGLGDERPAPDPELVRSLREHYREPNRRLEDLLGEDLSRWEQA